MGHISKQALSTGVDKSRRQSADSSTFALPLSDIPGDKDKCTHVQCDQAKRAKPEDEVGRHEATKELLLSSPSLSTDFNMSFLPDEEELRMRILASNVTDLDLESCLKHVQFN